MSVEGACPDCGERWDCCWCSDGRGDEEFPCSSCAGEGWVAGADIERYYDFGWIDPRKSYKCTNCGGSGLAKDMTVW